jgi:hypothetical protein
MSNPFGIFLKTPRYACVYKDFTLRSTGLFRPIYAHPLKIGEKNFSFCAAMPVFTGISGRLNVFGAPAFTANAPYSALFAEKY